MTRLVETWRNGRGPYWRDPCPAADGCCLSFHTRAKRVEYQRLWTALPKRCDTRPHPALVDNVLRNGDHATRDDRRLADELVHISLAAPAAVRDRDQFTARVVGRALADGITQFLDLGCGHIATSAAHAALAGHPTATIVHVDHDPHVDNHNLADLTEDPILMTRPRTLIHGNAFAIGPLLTSLYRTGALDPSQRVCVLLVDILYYLEAANNARSVIRRLVKRLPPRSWVAVTHLTNRALSTVDSPGGQAALRRDTDRWCQAMARCVPPHPQASSRSEFARRIADLDLLPPMITTTGSWPEPDTTRLAPAPYTLAAVGRVPEPTAAA